MDRKMMNVNHEFQYMYSESRATQWDNSIDNSDFLRKSSPQSLN